MADEFERDHTWRRLFLAAGLVLIAVLVGIVLLIQSSKSELREQNDLLRAQNKELVDEVTLLRAANDSQADRIGDLTDQVRALSAEVARLGGDPTLFVVPRQDDGEGERGPRGDPGPEGDSEPPPPDDGEEQPPSTTTTTTEPPCELEVAGRCL